MTKPVFNPNAVINPLEFARAVILICALREASWVATAQHEGRYQLSLDQAALFFLGNNMTAQVIAMLIHANWNMTNEIAVHTWDTRAIGEDKRTIFQVVAEGQAQLEAALAWVNRTEPDADDIAREAGHGSLSIH